MGRNSALMALLILFVLGSILIPTFPTRQNFSAILYQYAIIGFLALGQLLVILTSGIDLSQGSGVAFTSIVVAVTMKDYGLAAAVIAGLGSATLLGLVNGLLVARTRIPPFVVTLGMLGIARGLALLISDAKPVAVEVDAFADFGRANLWGAPVSVLLLLATGLGLVYFLKHRRLGRYIYAIGSNEESARLTGIDVRQVKLLVYTLSGLLTGVGGVIWTARLTSGSPIGASNYELESIAAVIVGGGSLFGGVGSVSGALVGVTLFGVINSQLNLLGISPYWQGTIKGVLILLAVALSQVRRVGAAPRLAAGTARGGPAAIRKPA
jgi:ribose/xylose/arabinose/galactoside ABC-type transport system permease subunit